MEIMNIPTFTIWALTSAGAVALLGVFALSGGRSRPRGSFPFGLFAVFWGFQIAFSNLAPFGSSPAEAQTIYLLGFSFLVPLPYLLIEFSASQQYERGRSRRLWTGLRALAVAAGLFPTIALFLEPSLVIQGVADRGGFMFPMWGPFYAYLVDLALYVALGAVVLALLRSQLNAPTPRTRTRTSLLLSGFGLYVAYFAGNNLGFYTIEFLQNPTQEGSVYILLFSFLAVVCLYSAVRAWGSREENWQVEERSMGTWSVVALVLPLMYGAAEAVASYLWWPYLYTVGIWRLAGVATITYGLARWRIFELPRKVRDASAVGTGILGAFVVGAALFTTLRIVLPSSSTFPLAMGAVGLAATAIPSIRYSRQLIAQDQGLDTPNRDEAIYRERIESYRAAVEASIARDTLGEDERFLRSLRERYNISPEEDRVVRLYAENAVAVPTGEDVVGVYERLRLLGAGGAGRTWLARDRSRERLVVLKEPLHHWQKDPEIKENVLQEARLASRVRHPNVVLIEQVVEDDGGRPVLVMEYLEGGSLADVLSRRGKLPWRKAVDVMVGVLQGLEAIHEAGIVHRDVKPSNILLTSEGTPKIGDFGVAIPRSGGNTLPAGADEESTPGVPDAGTPRYMAPEVVRGGSATKRSDVYSAATVLQEVLTGEPPQHDTPTLLPRDVPDDLARVLVRGLARQPRDRFESAGAFRQALARVLEREPPADPDPSDPEGSDGPIENFTSPDALSR